MWLEISQPVRNEFPGLEVRLVKLLGVRVWIGNAGALDAEVEAAAQRMRGLYSLETLKDVETVRLYRDFFWRVGIDPTKTRPSAEALLRRVLMGRPFPRVNSLVDAYNLASMETLIPIAAFDLDLLRMDLVMRRARRGEFFHGIGMAWPHQLTGRELVVEDREKLIAIYPYRDADSTKVTERTVNTLVMVCGAPKVPAARLEEATERVVDYITRHCGGRPVYND
ncbi:MAG: phenylalanine--tRNA ligase beta subunit-related protein [Nitrososphaerota archaeon]